MQQRSFHGASVDVQLSVPGVIDIRQSAPPHSYSAHPTKNRYDLALQGHAHLQKASPQQAIQKPLPPRPPDQMSRYTKERQKHPLKHTPWLILNHVDSL